MAGSSVSGKENEPVSGNYTSLLGDRSTHFAMLLPGRTLIRIGCRGGKSVDVLNSVPRIHLTRVETLKGHAAHDTMMA